VERKLRCVNFRRVSDPRMAFLPAFRATGSANDKPGSTWERRRRVCEHLDSQWSSLGKTTSSLGTLQVRLESIATTYRSTIFKTHVSSLYSDLCIYVSIHISTHLHCTRYIWTGCRRWLTAIRAAPENDNQVDSEIHCEAVIEQFGGCTWRP